jgi:nucleoside phosphorylase
MRVTQYPVVTLPVEEEQLLVSKTNIVFMTVTAIERKQFFVHLKPLPNYDAIVKINGKPQTYHIGVFGKYIVAHTQCKMGSVGRDSSQNVTNDTISEIKPSYIVMTGIAFGLKKKNKTLGDVIVSERIIPYEVARISKETTDWRGDSIRSGVTLFSRFENAIEWQVKGTKRKTPYKIHPGSVLSGEKLVDRKEFVKILEDTFPKAVGGEMEGAGVSSVCDRKAKEWIVVKGICDWGEGKGGKHQKMAAKTSTDLAHHVFKATNDLGTVSNISEFNAQKGSPLWALNRLRSDALSQLIKDLKLQEKSGIHDNVCLSVKEDLYHVIEALGGIPRHLSHGKTLEQVVSKFLEVYSAWNDIRGDSIESVEKRRASIAKLSKSRDRISRVVRGSSFLLGVGLSKESVNAAHQQQSDLVEKYPEIFPNLSRSVSRFYKQSEYNKI